MDFGRRVKVHIKKSFFFVSKFEVSHTYFWRHFPSHFMNPSTRFVNSLVYAAVGVFGALLVMGENAAITVGECLLPVSF